MIQITTEDGKYFFSEFVNLMEEQTAEIDENTLTLVDLQYILLAYKTKRITLSEGDLLKVNNKIKELSSTGGGGVMPDLSNYVTKQELIEEVFKLRGDLGEEITLESISQSLTEIDRLYSEIETKIEEVPENLSTTVTELQTFKSTVETDYTKKTDLDSYATLDHFDTLVNNLIFLATDKANEAVAGVVNGAPATFDTLKEIATWIENNGVDASDLATSISGKADKTELENYATVAQIETKADKTTIADFRTEAQINDLIDNKFIDEYVPDLATRLEGLSTQLGNKVDKVEGKGLSTEDFTTAYKTKLDVAVTSPEVSGIVETYVMEVYNPQLETSLGNALDTKLGITSPAVSATKLASPRTINGVSFDGTANITVADSTKLPTTGGTINGDLTVTGSVTLDTVLPISSGGTGATTLTDLKAALGVPQFIQITQEDYDLLSDIEKNDPLKLYLIIG